MPIGPKGKGNSRAGMGTAENQDDAKIPRPIAFWSDNERNAFRRNRVVQTRCRMLLDVINTQRETSKRAIRFEAHKFRQKREKSIRNQRISIHTDVPKRFAYSLQQPETGSDITRYDKMSTCSTCGGVKHIGDGENEKDVTPFLRLTCPGIITHAKKPSVRFSVGEDESDGATPFEGEEKPLRSEKLIRPHSEKQGHTSKAVSETRPIVTRSLSEVCLRDKNEDSRLLRRQKSAVVSFQTKGDYSTEAKTISDIGFSPRSETFFVKSKAAYQLRQDLKRQAILREQGVSQKTVTLSDYLDAERSRYIESSGKLQEYMKRIDSEKMFRPLMINKWTAADIEKQL